MAYTYNKEKNIIFFPADKYLCGISLQSMGDMKYSEENQNRKEFIKKINLNTHKIYGLNQTHSKKVLIVDSNNPPKIEADGMITNDKKIALSVTVADCLPVFLFDSVSGVFGIVHSGWAGTGIALEAVNLMKKTYNTNAQDVTAILGPCIGSCCYKVDDERAVVFEKEFTDVSVRKDNGNFYLDLKKANTNLLKDAGVNKIIDTNICTYCDTQFGSFRREGENFTRMLALICQMPYQSAF